MSRKTLNEISWALLIESSAASRLEAHRLRISLERLFQCLNNLENKEEIYATMGDLIHHIPNCLDGLDSELNRTNYTLTNLGSHLLEPTLSFENSNDVDNAFTKVSPFLLKLASDYIKEGK